MSEDFLFLTSKHLRSEQSIKIRDGRGTWPGEMLTDGQKYSTKEESRREMEKKKTGIKTQILGRPDCICGHICSRLT